MAAAETLRHPTTPYKFQYEYATRLKVECGCGAKYNTLVEGEDHARDTGHTLTLSGEIRTRK